MKTAFDILDFMDDLIVELIRYTERAKYVSDGATDDASFVRIEAECTTSLRQSFKELRCASDIVGDYLFQIEKTLKNAYPKVQQMFGEVSAK